MKSIKYLCVLVVLSCTTHFAFSQIVEFDFQCDQSAREFRLNIRNVTGDTIYIMNQSRYNMYSGSYIYLSTKDENGEIEHRTVSFGDVENGRWPGLKPLKAYGNMTLRWPFRLIDGDNAVKAKLYMTVFAKDGHGGYNTLNYKKELIISH